MATGFELKLIDLHRERLGCMQHDHISMPGIYLSTVPTNSFTDLWYLPMTQIFMYRYLPIISDKQQKRYVKSVNN